MREPFKRRVYNIHVVGDYVATIAAELPDLSRIVHTLAEYRLVKVVCMEDPSRSVHIVHVDIGESFESIDWKLSGMLSKIYASEEASGTHTHTEGGTP